MGPDPDGAAVSMTARALPNLALVATRAALESTGVIFIEESGEDPGVRLKKAKAE